MEHPDNVADLKRLKQFFRTTRKMIHNAKNSNLKYVVENEEFKVINKNTDQLEVSVTRLLKLNIEDEIQQKNIEIQEIGNTLLNSKYGFLFGFKSMDKYEQELHSIIEPNEIKYETLRKEIKDLQVLKYNHKVLMKQQMDELKLQQNVSIEFLKELELNELEEDDFAINKRLAMKEYIIKQKNILDLLMNPPKENMEINHV